MGLVETRQVRLFTPERPLVMAAGPVLSDVTIAFETYGTLNDARDNAIFICHALTGDAHAAGRHEGATRPGWWDNLIGPGRPVDTDEFFVVCPNLLGGCQGTTGPSSINMATGEAWGLDFPLLAMSDFVTCHLALGEYLGVEKWRAVIGGSLGGMQVLEWALTHPQTLDQGIVVAASSRLTAQNIAFSAVARQAIMRDKGFHDGKFAKAGDNPDTGLAIARMMAHITYLSEEAFAEKFGRSPQGDQPSPGFGVDFAVESYLNHQGEAFLTRFDALSYLYLSRVMDYFDPFAARGALAKLQNDPVRFLVLSFDSDWRFSSAHSQQITRVLEQAGLPVSYRDLRSPWGHDSFLLELPDYHATIRAFLQGRAVR